MSEDTAFPSSQIPKLASVLKADYFPKGDRAALKRMALDGPAPMAFHKFVVTYVTPAFQDDPRWRPILCALAIQRDGGFNPALPFGVALADVRFSEHRLERLLAATDETLQALGLRAARQIAAKGVACDWRQFADLIFSGSDAIRSRIARDFYKTLNKQSTKE